MPAAWVVAGRAVELAPAVWEPFPTGVSQLSGRKTVWSTFPSRSIACTWGRFELDVDHDAAHVVSGNAELEPGALQPADDAELLALRVEEANRPRLQPVHVEHPPIERPERDHEADPQVDRAAVDQAVFGEHVAAGAVDRQHVVGGRSRGSAAGNESGGTGKGGRRVPSFARTGRPPLTFSNPTNHGVPGHWPPTASLLGLLVLEGPLAQRVEESRPRRTGLDPRSGRRRPF